MIKNKDDCLKTYDFMFRFGYTPIKVLQQRLWPTRPYSDITSMIATLLKLDTIFKVGSGCYVARENQTKIIEDAALSSKEKVQQLIDDLQTGKITSDDAVEIITRGFK